MAYTQLDLDAIDAEIKSGTSNEQYSDGNGSRAVTTRSLSDLERIRSIIVADLQRQADGIGKSRIIRPIFL